MTDDGGRPKSPEERLDELERELAELKGSGSSSNGNGDGDGDGGQERRPEQDTRRPAASRLTRGIEQALTDRRNPK